MTHLEPAQIIEFVRGSGDDSARAEIEEHIDECEECRERIAEAARHARGEVPPPQRNDVDELTGTTIGRYRIGERLGAGGMGVVYLAEDIQLHRRVVIKLLRPELERAGNFERFRARLLREAQAMAQLSHPNVVQVYDLGAFDNSIYVAIEYLDGGDLRAWLAEKPRATSEILSLFLQAAHGLAAAHEIGIVHRDFKPANVVVGANGRAKVADFGLARPMYGNSADDSEDDPLSPEAQARPVGPMFSAITQIGALVGTPAYMAPEQAASEHVDARADQYSFCLALYQAIERVKPSAIVDASGAIRPPQLIPRQLWLAIRRGLSRRPDDRFASMNALIDALTPRSHAVRNGMIVLALASIGAATTWWFVRDHGSAPCAVPGLRQAAQNDAFASYAAQWRQLYAQTCSDPPELAHRRRACLDWRARAFDALAERTPALSKTELDELSTRLDPLKPCSTEHDLSLDPIAPPADLAPKIAELRVRMAKGEDAVAIAHAADTVGYMPLIAEAYLRQASTSQIAASKIDAYTKAIRAALVGNAVLVRVRALTGLSKVAPEWMPRASVATARLLAPGLVRSECLVAEPAERVYLPLDKDARDQRGHATKLLGDAANWIEGQHRGALDFDGFNDAIDLGSPPSLDNLPAITACAWVRPRKYLSNYPAILDKSRDTYAGGWNLYIQTDGTLGLLTPYREWIVGGLVRLDEWHHVCATWNGKKGYENIVLYVDGAQIEPQDSGINDEEPDSATLDADHRDNDDKNTLLVGRVNNGKFSFDGAIDEVHVWDRAASWSEIMQLYDCSFLR